MPHEAINLGDLDLLRDRVRCPVCGRWAGRLMLLADWTLACTTCACQRTDDTHRDGAEVDDAVS